jgi:hypothetical protein
MSSLLPALVFEQLNVAVAKYSAGIYESLFRARVPGGWLIVVHQQDGCGTTFIPDPEHLWNGGSL